MNLPMFLKILHPHTSNFEVSIREWMDELHREDLEIEFVQIIIAPAGGMCDAQIAIFYRLFPCEFGIEDEEE